MCLLEGTTSPRAGARPGPSRSAARPASSRRPLRRAAPRAASPGSPSAAWFQPTFQKWPGQLCGGLQVHVDDPRAFRPYRTTLAILREVRRLWPERELWRPPPYEYEAVRLPFDILAGDPAVREAINAGTPLARVERSWGRGLAAFRDAAESSLLYR